MRIVSLITLLLIVLPVADVFGQKGTSGQSDDGPVGIFQSRSAYNEFIGRVKRAAYGEGGSPELQAMVPMINDLALNKPVGWSANRYGGGASPLGMLAASNVRAELEMVDEQYEDLKRLNSEIQQRAAEQLRRIDLKDTSNLVERIRAIREQAQDNLNSVLLPHQLARLRQIRMQSLLRRRSLVDILTSDPVKSDLEITDRQSDELRQAEQEIEEELAKEIAKLREKARDRLLSRLKPGQKAEVEGMIGDAFDFSEPAKDKSHEKASEKRKNEKK